MTWQLSITGLLIGALVGLTGMGGGSLMTPILILFFGFQPTLAVGTDILHGAVFKSSARCGTASSGRCTHGSRSGCSSARRCFGSRASATSCTVGLGTVLLASGVRLIEFPAYTILLPVILVLGAIAAGLTEVRRLNARAVAAS